MPADGSRSVVLLALFTSLASAAASLWAAAATGASTLVAAGFLLLAAAASQALMLVGLYRSTRAGTAPASARRADLHVWCYVAALILFSFCAGIAVYEGIGKLADSPRILLQPHTGYAAIAFALILNAATLARIIVETRHLGPRDPDHATRLASANPALVTTLIETVAVLIGLVIAALGVGLAHATGSPVADGNAALLIGLLIGTVAAVMGVEIRRLLVTGAAPAPAWTVVDSALLGDDASSGQAGEAPASQGEAQPRLSRREQKRRQQHRRRQPQQSET